MFNIFYNRRNYRSHLYCTGACVAQSLCYGWAILVIQEISANG